MNNLNLSPQQYVEKINYEYANNNKNNSCFEDFVGDFLHKDKPDNNDYSLDIKIAVSSNIFYYEKTLPTLLSSLENANIDKNNIHIFMGGGEEYKKVENEYTTHYLDHNSFCIAPLIEICEKSIKAEYWFLIQDTCRVGKHFKKLLYNIPKNNFYAIAMTDNPSMNMGLYNYNFLKNSENILYPLKNKDYTKEGLDKAKFMSVAHEDVLLRNRPIYPREAYLFNFGIKNIYNNGVERRVEYYPSLDIFKYKANWHHNTVYVREV